MLKMGISLFFSAMSINIEKMEFRRIDSRKQYEMRPYAVELGISKEADGSSRFSQGDTEILATITG